MIATHLEEQRQDQSKPNINFSKKPLEVDLSLWNSLAQMESQAITKLAIASLKKGVNSRQSEDSTILLFFLKDIPILQVLESEFDRPELLQLITALRYERFEHGDEIYHQGEEIPQKLFFILSGQCLIKTTEIQESEESDEIEAIQQTPSPHLQKHLREKDTFGEDSLTQQGDNVPIAKQTIMVLTEELECAILNQDLYFTLKRNAKQKKELSKMRLIKQCPIFKGLLTNKQASDLRKCFQSRLFSYRQTVYSEGDFPQSVFIVKSGRFRLTKKVTFNKNIEHPPQIPASRNTVSSKEQNVVVLVEGGCFGDEELLKRIDSRVYSVICESAQGELLEICAKDFFKALTQKVNKDEFQAINTLHSVKYDWRNSNATNCISIQEKYLDYLIEPPRQAYEAKHIFTRRKSPLVEKRSISEQKQFRIVEREASSSEKQSPKQEHFYYNYYKKEDVRFFNDEEFCYQPKAPECVTSIKENSNKTTIIRRRSTISTLTETNAMQNSNPSKQNTNQISTSRPSRRYQSNELRQLDQKNDQILTKKGQSTLPFEDSLHRKQQIRQRYQIQPAGLAQKFCDVSQKFIQLHKAKCRNLPILDGGINLKNSNVSSIAEENNNNNKKSYQMTPRQVLLQLKTIDTRKGHDKMISYISKSAEHSSQEKKSEQVHFSFQENDAAALEKRMILKRKKISYYLDSAGVHHEAERGKRILDNYIVNYAGNRKGSQSGSENKDRLYDGQLNNEQVDAKALSIRGMLHEVNSSQMTESEIFREQNMVKNTRLLNKKLHPIRKTRAILKNLISL